MAWRLTPKDDRFYTLFAAAAENLVTGVRLLEEQLAAPVDDRPELAVRMHETEHAGDDATHEIFSAVNTTFVTPFDREDMYALAGRLDDVLDHMDAAADLLVLYRPAEIPKGVDEQVDVLSRAADLEVAYDPNDCPEVRWGAPRGSDEASTCTRRAPGDQVARMRRYRAWFHERRRPPRG